jgi:DNA repair exonuclease SbcCD ATPase subunit
MKQAAAKARAEADTASSALKTASAVMDKLVAKAKESGAKKLKAKKKATALQKLNAAEKQLVTDMKEKLRNGELALGSDEAALRAALFGMHGSEVDAARLKKLLEEANNKLSKMRADDHKVQSDVKMLDGQIVMDRKVHIDLSAKLNQASSISIPENTPVDEAKRMLEEKQKNIMMLTSNMLAIIKKEKSALSKKHTKMQKLSADKAGVVDEAKKVAELSGESQKADDNLANATAAEKKAKETVDAAKANVTEDKKMEAEGETNLQNVEEKEKDADKDAQNAEDEDNKDKKDLNSEESKVNSLESDMTGAEGDLNATETRMAATPPPTEAAPVPTAAPVTPAPAPAGN